MREIKFRAWDKEKKLMFDVSELLFYPQDLRGGVQYVIPDRADARYSAGEALQIMNIVLEQYTGLKDDSGKEEREVYENDQYRGIQSGIIYTVEQLEGEWSLTFETPRIGKRKLGSLHYALNNVVMEYIGDIHTNSEVLESETFGD